MLLTNIILTLCLQTSQKNVGYCLSVSRVARSGVGVFVWVLVPWLFMCTNHDSTVRGVHFQPACLPASVKCFSRTQNAFQLENIHFVLMRMRPRVLCHAGKSRGMALEKRQSRKKLQAKKINILKNCIQAKEYVAALSHNSDCGQEDMSSGKTRQMTLEKYHGRKRVKIQRK